MNAISEEKQSLCIKFGGLAAGIFFVIIAPFHNYLKLQHELDAERKQHQEYVAETNQEIATLNTQIDHISQEYQKSASFKREATCLADNIYHEIGTNSDVGMRAVAQVTLNRKRDGFANTICGVVKQKKNGVCQFSWVCSDHKPHTETYTKAYEVARKSLTTGVAYSKLNDALYYHADYVNPSWSYEKNYIAQIGPHIFYSER